MYASCFERDMNHHHKLCLSYANVKQVTYTQWVLHQNMYATCFEHAMNQHHILCLSYVDVKELEVTYTQWVLHQNMYATCFEHAMNQHHILWSSYVDVKEVTYTQWVLHRFGWVWREPVAVNKTICAQTLHLLYFMQCNFYSLSEHILVHTVSVVISRQHILYPCTTSLNL